MFIRDKINYSIRLSFFHLPEEQCRHRTLDIGRWALYNKEQCSCLQKLFTLPGHLDATPLFERLRVVIRFLCFSVFLFNCCFDFVSLFYNIVYLFIFATCLSFFIDLRSVDHILVSSVFFVVSMILYNWYIFASVVRYIIFLILNGNIEMRNSRFNWEIYIASAKYLKKNLKNVSWNYSWK